MIVTFILLCVTAAPALTVYVSTSDQATMGGVTFGRGDVVAYNMERDLARLYFDHTRFRASDGTLESVQTIDGIHLISSDSFLLSTSATAQLGQPLVTFSDGDIVRYAKDTDTAATLQRESSMFWRWNGRKWLPSTQENVDALARLENGHILLSTAGTANVGSNRLAIGIDDVAEYDPVAGSASILLDGKDVFFDSQGNATGGGNVDGISVDELNGVLYFSTGSLAYVHGTPATLLKVNPGDIVAYNLTSRTASIFLSKDVFVSRCGTDNIDGLSIVGFAASAVAAIPEPATIVGAGLGLVGIGGYLRRRKQAA